MRDRLSTIGPIAAMAGAVGLCCGLPVLLSMGILGAVAGWSVQSWILVGLGLALAAVGWAGWVTHGRRERTCPLPVAAAPVVNAATEDIPVNTSRTSTDTDMRGINP